MSSTRPPTPGVFQGAPVTARMNYTQQQLAQEKLQQSRAAAHQLGLVAPRQRITFIRSCSCDTRLFVLFVCCLGLLLLIGLCCYYDKTFWAHWESPGRDGQPMKMNMHQNSTSSSEQIAPNSYLTLCLLLMLVVY